MITIIVVIVIVIVMVMVIIMVIVIIINMMRSKRGVWSARAKFSSIDLHLQLNLVERCQPDSCKTAGRQSGDAVGYGIRRP
eukprot:669951-Karenia_brevis.AAC.1